MIVRTLIKMLYRLALVSPIVTLSFAALPSADYVLSDDVGVERKTASDFVASIPDRFLGRLAEAQKLLRTALALLDAPEATVQQHLTLLLLYGQVLVVDHFLTRGENAELVFWAILQARQLAEATQDQQGLADAMSLLGQAHYFASVVGNRRHGVPLSSTPGDGKYDQALLYQQQALELRQALQDTRGMSESYFQIGVVYERWQQYARSQDYYTKARQIADQYDYPFEMTEPARHVAFQALREGNIDRALALRKAAGFRPYLPLDHLLLRDIYLAKGDTARAQLHAQHAQALAEDMGLQTLVASVPNIDHRAMFAALIEHGANMVRTLMGLSLTSMRLKRPAFRASAS